MAHQPKCTLHLHLVPMTHQPICTITKGLDQGHYTWKEHWVVVKRFFKYLHGTTIYVLCYQGRLGLDKVLDIHGFVDVDWTGDLDHRRSTSGYVFNLFGGEISWIRRIQFVMELSTTKYEYTTTTHARKEAVL
jgi:hypothetical protein